MIQSHTEKSQTEKAVFNTRGYRDNHTAVNTNCQFRALISKLFDDRREAGEQGNRHRSSVVQTGLQTVPFKFKNHPSLNLVSVNIVESPERNIDISSVLSSIVTPKHFNVSPILPSNSLCPCPTPCPWGSKWTKLSKQPQDAMLYNSLKKTPINVGMLTQIQKDMKRTQPLNKGYKSFTNRKLLQQVLQIYSKYDKQLQYIQGMNLIASVILYHVHKPQPTFWVLVDIMERKEFREIYVNKFQNLPKHTQAVNSLIQQALPKLWKHLIKLEIEFEWVSTGWLLSLLCNLVPLDFGHLVIDRFIKDGWQALYQIIVAYLSYEEQKLLIKQDHSDLLSYFSPSVREETIDWHQIILDSYNVGQSK